MSDHVIVKLRGHAPGYYVTRRPEPCDEPDRMSAGAQLLIEVDGPFGTYESAMIYIADATARSSAVDGEMRAVR